MTQRARAVLALVLAACLTWHALGLLSPEKQQSPRDSAGRDYASYHYAAEVAAGGGDPWSVEAIRAAAAAEGLRKNVHPFFYPPPYLLLTAWAPAVPMLTGFEIWRWIDEIATILTGIALAVWWQPLGRKPGSELGEIVGPAAVAVLVAGVYGVLYGHQMGQANFLVLLVTVAGLWLEPRRPWLGGALVGAACMWKMSPALFVAWWLLHRRWQPAAAAVITAIALSIAALPLAGPAEQLRFYTEILPGFGSGNYNGLTIRIDMFGNHSVPNVFEQLWPGDQTRLSGPAQAASTATALAVVAGLALALRRPPGDLLGRAAHIGAICIALLLVPVYTYEHHLIWAIPAIVAAIAATWQGRLEAGWGVALGIAIAALAAPLPDVKELSAMLGGPAGWVVQEAKFFGLIAVGAACVVAAVRAPRMSAG
jgi:hypothetical protein